MDRKANIFKGLKFHLNELKRLRPNYEWVMIAVQGSQNYNLDIDHEDYKSDIDTIAIVLPPFSNFVNNDKYISETIILDNNEHIDVKDIRQIFDIFAKQNIKYLEILCTDFRIINARYKEEVLNFLGNSDHITQANPEKLITCTYGMAMEKLKALEHPYEGLKEKIAKYGYDGKQLHHIIRLFYFAERYINNGYDFRGAMDFSNIEADIYYLLINAKKNEYNLEKARELAKEYIDRISVLRKDFAPDLEKETNENYAESILNSTKVLIFNRYFTEMFTPKEVEKKPLLLPSIDKIWVTSDLHFGHENILGFEDKRWELMGTNFQKALVQTIKDEGLTDEEIKNMSDEMWNKFEKICNHNHIKQHDEELIRRWNNKVANNDLVFILGDLSFRGSRDTEAIVKRLNGRKVLVLGNHDNIWLNKEFDRTLFEEIVNYKEININGYMFCLSHYPHRVWNKQHKGSIHLFGHIHSNETTSHPMKEEIQHSYNVGVDVRNYEPVNLKVFAMTADYYKKIEEINEKML